MMEMLDAFLRAKRLQGLTEKSLKSYRDIFTSLLPLLWMPNLRFDFPAGGELSGVYP